MAHQRFKARSTSRCAQTTCNPIYIYIYIYIYILYTYIYIYIYKYTGFGKGLRMPFCMGFGIGLRKHHKWGNTEEPSFES